MEVKNNAVYPMAFKGNFILSKTLSKGEAELVERFNKFVYSKKNKSLEIF